MTAVNVVAVPVRAVTSAALPAALLVVLLMTSLVIAIRIGAAGSMAPAPAVPMDGGSE